MANKSPVIVCGDDDEALDDPWTDAARLVRVGCSPGAGEPVIRP